MLVKLNNMLNVDKYKLHLNKSRKIRMLDDLEFNERILQRSKYGF